MECGIQTDIKTNRNGYADFLKGLLVILVVLGHVIQSGYNDTKFYENFAFKLIYSFHMPLFAIISGYYYYFSLRKKSTVSVILNKAKYLLIPIIVCSGAIKLAGIVRHWGERSLKQEFLGYIDFVCHAYWFLRITFICCVIVGIIYVLSRKVEWIENILLVLAGISIFFIHNGGYLQFLLPFFIIGYIANKYKILEHFGYIKDKYLFLLLFSVMYIVLVYYKMQPNVYIYNNGESLLEIGWTLRVATLWRVVFGFVGSIWFIWLTYFIYHSIKLKFSALSKLGQLSLEMFVMQDRIVGLCAMVSSKITTVSVYYVIIDLIITMIVTLGVIFIIKKSKIVNVLIFANHNPNVL